VSGSRVHLTLARRSSIHCLHVRCGRLHCSRLYEQHDYINYHAAAQTFRSATTVLC